MIEINKNDIARLKEVIYNAENFVIVCHVNPDGDAIGSSTAMCKVLEKLGKKANVIIPNGLPDFLQWIDFENKIIDYQKQPTLSESLFGKCEVLICLDFNDFERGEGLKNLLAQFVGTSVLIDHHPSPQAQCDIMFSHPEACSTCDLLFRILEHAGYSEQIDKSAAEAIFTGIMTDTGNFSYNSSDPDTFRTVAKLLERGINRDEIHSTIYNTFTAERWRLIGFALKDKMVILPEYRTAYICLSIDELEAFGYQQGDTEGLVNYPLSIKGIIFSILITEKKDKVRLSFRSRGSFPTNAVSSKYFNGGGHINASGGDSGLPLDKTLEKLISILPEYKEQLLSD